MQRILCRVAQSQGNFAVKNTKLQVPSCTWHFIKDTLTTKGIESNTVKFSQPRSFLSWGLVYNSCRHTGYLDVLRFDTVCKLQVFRAFFGNMAGFGVRKKRPKYSDGRFLLTVNDVLNVVSCPSQEQVDDNNTNCLPFQRFGVTEDGIDLAYDASEGTLQIVLRYRKVVVTSESIQSLADVGVAAVVGVNKPKMGCALINMSAQSLEMLSCVAPGMEFIDNLYVMRVQDVFKSTGEIRAKKVYKIHETTRRTTNVNTMELVTYTDVAFVYQQIQEMLE
ncbi:hypothetical protein MHU86_13464 [Fragilaria crotonensis]|nr:hypothetical protein MHU86_13464 [Fragilaria crotonensis]